MPRSDPAYLVKVHFSPTYNALHLFNFLCHGSHDFRVNNLTQVLLCVTNLDRTLMHRTPCFFREAVLDSSPVVGERVCQFHWIAFNPEP